MKCANEFPTSEMVINLVLERWNSTNLKYPCQSDTYTWCCTLNKLGVGEPLEHAASGDEKPRSNRFVGSIARRASKETSMPRNS